jgi:hypothetical protein
MSRIFCTVKHTKYVFGAMAGVFFATCSVS